LAASAVIVEPNPTTPDTVRKVVPLWNDATRAEQLARLGGLQLQADQDLGEKAWKLAHSDWLNLPEKTRVDLPSSHVFASILGLLRTGATLKKNKILLFEISAKEIAKILKYSKSTIEAALRWLGSGPIEYRGAQIAQGIGFIHRARRTGAAFLKGKLQRIYRTSKLSLTTFGRAALGLISRDDEKKREKRAARQEERKQLKKKTASKVTSIHQLEIKHAAAKEDASTTEVGKSWLKNILNSL